MKTLVAIFSVTITIACCLTSLYLKNNINKNILKK